MPTLNQLYPSRFLKAEDLDGKDTSYTIQGLELEEVGQDQEEKPILYFTEIDKGLVVNKTNFKAIAGIHGADSDDWPGKKITLYPTEVEFSGKTALGIRVRLPKPAAKPTTTAPDSGQRPPMPEFSPEEIPAEPVEDEQF